MTDPLPPELALEAEPFPITVLDDVLEGGGPDFDPESYGGRAQRWQVTDDGAAEWALRHLAAAVAEVEAADRQAAEWHLRIEDWHTDVTRKPSRRHAFFARHLERYALARRAADPDAKTLVLPSGRVSTTAGKPRLVVTDPDAFAEYARANPDDPMVKVTYAPDAVEAKKRLVMKDGRAADTLTGEWVEWAVVEVGETTAKVVPAP